MKYTIKYHFVKDAPSGCAYQAHVFDAEGQLAFIRCRNSFEDAKAAAVTALQVKPVQPPPDEEVEI
jgi:hypothetical protein